MNKRPSDKSNKFRFNSVTNIFGALITCLCKRSLFIALTLLIFGLAISASGANEPPTFEKFDSNKPSPQEVASMIRWTATATDPDGDPVFYKFQIKGPSTSDEWQVVQDWSIKNWWGWKPDESGDYEIDVWIRDGNHASENRWDDNKIASYIISERSGSTSFPGRGVAVGLGSKDATLGRGVTIGLASDGDETDGIRSFGINQLPVATGLTPNKPSGQTAGTAVTFTATATDPDPGDAIRYRFWVKGPGTAGWDVKRDWSSSNIWTWTTTTSDIGSSEISVWVRDDKHADINHLDSEKKIASYVINPAANQPPIATGLTPNKPSGQTAGTAVTFTATAPDPDPGDAIRYRFWVKGPGTAGWEVKSDWSSSNTWTWTTTTSDIGSSEISVWVRDDKHADINHLDSEKKIASYVINPAANQPPVATGITPNRLSPQVVGTTIVWTSSAYDPDGDTILYRYWLKGPSTGNAWKVMRDWTSSNKWTWSAGASDNGQYDIAVCIRDGKHETAGRYDDCVGYKGYQIVRPITNQPPEATSLVPNKLEPQIAGSTIVWTVGAYDPDGDSLLYKFWLRGPSTGDAWTVAKDWSYSNTWSWTSGSANAGEYDVYVYVRDGNHASAGSYDSGISHWNYQLSVPVVNQLPVLSGVTPNKPSPQMAGSVISWKATAYDPDGDLLLYRFWLKGPSTGNSWTVIQDWSYSDTWTWSSGSTDAGEYDVYVYVRDGKHASATSSDSRMGYADYQLVRPGGVHQLTFGETNHDRPSLLYADGGYLLAYQSWEAGSYYQGDVFLERLDSSWNQLKRVQATSKRAYEDFPSVVYYDGYYYAAYVSDEYGNFDIFVKKYDLNLNLVETQRLTTLSSDQDRPSLVRVGNDFYLAYQSWETVSSYGGDIFIERFDQFWNSQGRERVTFERSYQDSPSLVYANGRFYVAYTSQESGNLDIFVKTYDMNLKELEKKKLTYYSSDQDYPSLFWQDDTFYLAYGSMEGSDYDLYMEEFDSSWNLLERYPFVQKPNSQTWPSLAYNPLDGLLWVAYVSQEDAGWNIFIQPVEPVSIGDCYVLMDFTSTSAYSPYILSIKFYNGEGKLADPSRLGLTRSEADGMVGTFLSRISTGTYQLNSRFEAPGSRTFTVSGTLDGCNIEKTVTIQVV